MKKSFILIQFFLLLSFCFLTAICWSKTDTDSSSYQLAPSNYWITRYVIGSGGLPHAFSPNHIHAATAGETSVGFMQGTNHLLISGFWSQFTFGAALTSLSEINEEKVLDRPTSFELHQNYPNPCNPQTTIRYELPEECLVNVEIFNVLGQRIRLVSSQIQGPGYAQVVWDGCDEQGTVMGSGIYLHRVTAFGIRGKKNKNHILFQQTKKMLLVK